MSATHISQVPVPVEFLYVPVSHTLHANPSEPAVYPTIHLQAINITLPCAELVPVGQTEQSPSPDSALYLPVSHTVQVVTPPKAGVYPATHLQSVTLEPQGGVAEPAGHDSHPVCVLYSSSVQSIHCASPMHSEPVLDRVPPGEVWPSGHIKHTFGNSGFIK